MAGIGDFIIGRKKSPSRIVIDRKKLEEKLNSKQNYINESLEKQNNENIDLNNNMEESTEDCNETNESNSKSDSYTISIPIDSGVAAKIIIPKDTSKDEAELIKDMIDVIFKRRFGV